MKSIKKILMVLAIAVVAVSFYLNAVAKSNIVNATQQDACDQETTYVKSGDHDDNRVDINFTSFQGDSNRRVVIDPANGYELVFIGVDWTGSDANEATPSVGNGTQTITFDAPNNETIDNITVKVKKVCDKVNICHNTSSQTNPIEAIRVNFDAFDGQGSNDHTQHGDFLYNGPVNPQNQQPLKPEGDKWCEDNDPSNTPTPTVTVTPSATLTPTVTVTPTVSPTITPIITAEPTPGITETPSVTPTPTGQGGPDCENNPQADVCIDCPGDGECEVVIGSPTPTVTPTEVPATPTPTTGGQGGTSLSSSDNSGSTGGVSATNAPVATFANTGAFANSLSNIMLALGVIATSASAALYGKKKKAIQK